jgi:hypothetical protein
VRGASHAGALTYLGHALGVTGSQAEGRKVLEEQALSQVRCSRVHGMGEREQPLRVSKRIRGTVPQRLDSARIRSDLGFKSLMRRMGLAAKNSGLFLFWGVAAVHVNLGGSVEKNFTTERHPSRCSSVPADGRPLGS